MLIYENYTYLPELSYFLEPWTGYKLCFLYLPHQRKKSEERKRSQQIKAI